MSNISRYLRLSRKKCLSPLELDEWNELEKWIDNIGNEEYNYIKREYLSRINKYKRIKRFIEENYSFSNNNYFITFTINDNYINLKRNTYLKHLKAIFKDKVAILNTDYGALNERLHFHAICFDIDNTDFLHAWSYGFTNAKLIRKFEDKVKLAKYVSKLCNHAIKVNSHIIYYRKL